MKIVDVYMGQDVWTKVSGERTLVRVVRIDKVRPHGRSSRLVRRVVVKRVDNGTLLPKARSAAVLQPIRHRFVENVRKVTLPRKAGEIITFKAHGKQLKVKRTASRSWFMQTAGRQRWADSAEDAREDVEHFLEYGSLPREKQTGWA